MLKVSIYFLPNDMKIGCLLNAAAWWLMIRNFHNEKNGCCNLRGLLCSSLLKWIEHLWFLLPWLVFLIYWQIFKVWIEHLNFCSCFNGFKQQAESGDKPNMLNIVRRRSIRVTLEIILWSSDPFTSSLLNSKEEEPSHILAEQVLLLQYALLL